MSTTVRIGKETHNRLCRLSEQTGISQKDLLEEAIEELERKRFFDALDEAYSSLREDEQAWAEEKRERELWANTLGDGLENEP